MLAIRTTFLGPALACTVALLTSGCGDDGENPEAAELSGVFQAGGVAGLRYETPTRSGLTDSGGSFKYLAGESVSFSVGGIDLGHAPGAAQITPFTLAGLTPPTTEPSLRRELDRASRTTSNFVRAVNMTRLLLALDADHDPASGLDLRGRDAGLANARLVFDQTIPQFAAALEKLAPDLTHNMPHWLPIVHLYRVLGIAVPAQAPTQYDYDSFGSITHSSSVSYYPDGSVESRRSIDGFGAGSNLAVYAYDTMGRTTSARSVRFSTFFGSYIDEAVTQYDAHGNLETRSHEIDQGADGTLDATQLTTFETDAYANIVGEVTRYDFGRDGTIERIDTFAAQFDARLNPVSSTSETDSNMDGVADSRTTFNAVFDAANRVTAQNYETDDLADGIVEWRNSVSTTYAATGPDAIEIYEYDASADGDVDSRARYDWVHDASGALRTLTIEGEYNFDGNAAAAIRYREVITFDRDRRILSDVTSEDWDADGAFDLVSSRTRSYGSYGNVLEEVTEMFSGGDGEWTSRYVHTYEYGVGAELLGATNALQFQPGGPLDSISSMRVTNIPLANGVLMLAQSYLEFSLNTGAVAAF